MLFGGLGMEKFGKTSVDFFFVLFFFKLMQDILLVLVFLQCVIAT